MGIASGGLVLLSEMRETLPPSEQKIADYILENPEKTVGMTVSELGELSQTSGAAVTRLCKSLKLKGFQELKLRINGDLGRKVETIDRDIKPNEPVSITIQKVTEQAVQTLLETAELIDSQQLELAVKAIVKANNIHFFGVGASGISAIDAQQKFLRIHKASTVSTDLHMGATIVANTSKEDVVFGISFSGNTFEVEKILELANEKGATTISLTKYGQSPISQISDIQLYTSPTREANFRSGATSSRLAQLHVMDILFMSVASKQFDTTITYLDSTREAIEDIQNQTFRKKKK
ncbi:MurR/RpiR family transcriptional regulator [Psychrobacillus sp. NEAU-3TGS]|uniref:MurR/RpiR family transcriptional regulator n=1 Tax=Psychrobacillus sp. NEAU-3TGS TaxID=2995412 RepID=UPI002499A5C6|nr:MurR/RpiR family transcriptional regulator [Psychrobacillus sp. NEAU-3TGS]MDI2587181.1 MurR/RpiR family transcriptional regulator [Psychrobacillus sp. NEAU-3TGS]